MDECKHGLIVGTCVSCWPARIRNPERANKPGRCSLCPDAINVGDRVAYHLGRAVHEVCLVELGYQEPDEVAAAKWKEGWG